MTDDPAEKMRVARRLAAISLGVAELPPDADIEMALGEDGVLHVRGSLVVDGFVPRFEVEVSVKPSSDT